MSLVRPRGLEPPRVLPHSDLNAARLPVPPRSLTWYHVLDIFTISHKKARIFSINMLVFFTIQPYLLIMTLEWKTSDLPVAYPDAVAAMERRVANMIDGNEGEQIWLLEHPPLYTAGTSAKQSDLLDNRFPVFNTGRGGEYTYHGPGQRVAYVMLNLEQRNLKDIRKYVWSLEEWIIRTLAIIGIHSERREGRIGIWVVTPSGEKKIAAIGVRVRKWMTYHGIAINVNPDLSHFGGIVPCGIKEYGVTSLHELGKMASMSDLDEALQRAWTEIFTQ